MLRMNENDELRAWQPPRAGAQVETTPPYALWHQACSLPRTASNSVKSWSLILWLSQARADAITILKYRYKDTCKKSKISVDIWCHMCQNNNRQGDTETLKMSSNPLKKFLTYGVRCAIIQPWKAIPLGDTQSVVCTVLCDPCLKQYIWCHMYEHKRSHAINRHSRRRQLYKGVLYPVPETVHLRTSAIH